MKQQVNGMTVPSLSDVVVVGPRDGNKGALRRKGQPDEHGLRDYAFMLRRRWKMIVALAAGMFVLFAIGVYLKAPTYRADVLVVIQPPNVSPGQSSVILPQDVQKKLDALREQVESRRTLTDVMKKFDLYPVGSSGLPSDDQIDDMRKSITLKLGKSSFNISFDHRNPQTAADVANELARQYIEENTRLRRESLQNTSMFISTQLKRLEKDVKDVELTLQDFRKQNLGALPEDVPANQALLMALSSQAAQAEANLDAERLRKRKAEDRVTDLLQKEITARQKSIRSLQKSLKAMPVIQDIDGNDASAQGFFKDDKPAEVLQNEALPVSHQKDSEAKAIPQLPRLDAPAAPRQPAALDEVVKGENNPVEMGVDEGDAQDAADNVELEMTRQALRMKETLARDARQNLDDMQSLLKKGMVSELVVKKARTDYERAEGELRIQRAQMIRSRRQLEEKLQTSEQELAQMKGFQGAWSELLVKIQEIEAQRLRITATASEDTIGNASKRIETMTAELAAMRTKSTEKYSTLFSARGELAQQVQEHENIMATIVRQQNEIQTMKTRVADLDRRLTNSARVQVALPELMRKYKTVTDQYEAMLRHKMQADMAMGVEDQQEGERMVIWDPAVPNTSPYRPRYQILLAGGFVGCSGIAVALALLLELIAPKFLESERLRSHTGHEVVAAIDELPNDEIPQELPDSIPAHASKVVALSDPWHRVSKQFFDCSCLLFKARENWPRIVAVCSPGTGDGKTFVASNLAAALAATSRQTTLLIDANLRAPKLHELFEVPQEHGLAEALEGGSVSAHPIKGMLPSDLQLLTAGYTERHPAVLLGSPRFHDLMEKINYEGVKPRIILDTPALKGGADVDVLLDGVDGVLLVVRRGHTQMTDVDRALRRIPPEKLLGVVFNGNPA